MRACLNHLREDLTDIDADLLNIGMCSLLELLFRMKFADFPFISSCSFVSYLWHSTCDKESVPEGKAVSDQELI